MLIYMYFISLIVCDLADRAPPPPREEVPLPTAPPYTAFVGNLAFDMTEGELEEFFTPNKVCSHNLWFMTISDSFSPSDDFCEDNC